jgi:hypothetical protein
MYALAKFAAAAAVTRWRVRPRRVREVAALQTA